MSTTASRPDLAGIRTAEATVTGTVEGSASPVDSLDDVTLRRLLVAITLLSPTIVDTAMTLEGIGR